jgi:hypothetical protein
VLYSVSEIGRLYSDSRLPLPFAFLSSPTMMQLVGDTNSTTENTASPGEEDTYGDEV